MESDPHPDQFIIFAETDGEGLTTLKPFVSDGCWVVSTGGVPWAVAGSYQTALAFLEDCESIERVIVWIQPKAVAA